MIRVNELWGQENTFLVFMTLTTAASTINFLPACAAWKERKRRKTFKRKRKNNEKEYPDLRTRLLFSM